jgi:peptidoglycan-associated lipoprotein
MRNLTKRLALLLVAPGFGLMAPWPAVAQGRSLVDAGVAYNYVRSNAPAGGCGCLSLNGGSGWVGFNFTRSIAIVGELSSQHASGISGTRADLTLTSFLVGPRYTLTRTGHLAPFVQLLLGGAHAGGTLAPGGSALSESANAFAFTAGGGLDIGLTRHIALRAFQADYYLTHFDNGINNRQNNLRIAAGVIFRFGETK